MYRPSGSGSKGKRTDRPVDVELARSICDGSIEAWHEFIDQYSGLIYSVVRRHFYSEDEEEVRTISVDVLQSLFDGDIGKYSGESSLACWLTAFSRNKAIDHFRRRYGRRKHPQGFEKLSEFDKKILKLFYAERLHLGIIVSTLQWFGYDVSADDIIESVYRIEDTISGRYLESLTNEHYAKMRGARSPHSIRHLVSLRLESELRTEKSGPEADLVDKEIARTVENVAELVSKLSSLDRKLIYLRFTKGLSAREIAEDLEIENYKSVYRLIEKALDRIRESTD